MDREIHFGDLRASGRLIVALDGETDQMSRLIDIVCAQAFPPTLFFKLGLRSVAIRGFEKLLTKLVHLRADLGPDRPLSIFLDLKLFDTAQTVREACRSFETFGIDMISVSADQRVIEAALEGVRAACPHEKYRAKVIAVPHLSDGKLPGDWVATANLAVLSADGIVCRPDMLSTLRRGVTEHKIFVCPGIREANDPVPSGHTLACLPDEAIRLGADFIVVGRPIFTDVKPLQAAYSFAHAAARGAGEEPYEGWGANE